jgi:hypothetical protein
MRTVAFVAVVLLATAAFVKRGLGWSTSGDHTAAREATIDARGARLIRVETGAGELRVLGVDGLSEARVRGTAHASRSGLLDDIKVELRRDGDQLVARSVIPAATHRRWFGGSASRSLDLVIEVPAALEADVTDGSGDVEVRGVSALRIKDGSGELRVLDVHGAVRVQDGSGDLELSGIGGDAWVEDGSGNVSAKEIAGSLVIAVDGSGEVTARAVQGDMLVRRDGSGDIDVANVGGRLIVERDGSGEVRYEDVRGGVELPRKKVARRE